MSDETLILGAGMTGLAAGISSGFPVIEAADASGGICLSYYVRPGSDEMLSDAPDDDEAYRFENGGGHWIFGGDAAVLNFIESQIKVQRYGRQSSVYFPKDGSYAPYPIQNHLRFLDTETSVKALDEMARPAAPFTSMKEWLEESFGPTLGEMFFKPFHELYTAGLYDEIAPQDAYKSPVNLSLALRGALDDAPAVGYNTTFIYPAKGLNTLARNMAERCTVEYGKRVSSVDTDGRKLTFEDGSSRNYKQLISTLPLNQMMDMCGLSVEARPDPHSSVLVLNIGAVRGERCPDDHWLYIPYSDANFHRVGFYSNVDRSFLPASARAEGNRVSIYIEKAYPAGQRPSDEEVAQYSQQVVEELQRWGFIGEAEVVHPTWVDVAYTWSWPGSTWKPQALKALEDVGIHQVGRYGRWIFQGIADSIRDGFIAGSSFKR